jgi:transcriptional regulator with XRE-family HTH domain
MNETSEGIPWFAANLRRAREDAGLTQQELVRRVRRDTGRPFSQQTYSKIETGAQEPVLSVARSLARNLGTDVETLSRPPAEVSVKLEILSVTRQVQDARREVLVAAARFRERQQRLGELVAAVGDEDAGPEALLALKLSLEDD